AATDLLPIPLPWGDNVFLYDRLTGQTKLVSHAFTSNDSPGGGGGPLISADGSAVAFTSQTTDLVPGFTDASGQTQQSHIYVYDRDSGQIALADHVYGAPSTAALSSANNGAWDLSANGRYVTFTGGKNIVNYQTTSYNVFRYDRL